jgi:branched-chain amino acid transport system substrate-binding protein
MKIAKENVTRRRFLSELTVGAAGLAATAGATTYFAGPRAPHAAVTFKGNIPDTPYKTGHITYLTGPANLLGEPGRQGHILAGSWANARSRPSSPTRPQAPTPTSRNCGG